MNLGIAVFGLLVLGGGVALVVIAKRERYVRAKAEVLFSDCSESTCIIGLEFSDAKGIAHVVRLNAGGPMTGTTDVMYDPKKLSSVRVASFMDLHGKTIGIVALVVGSLACLSALIIG